MAEGPASSDAEAPLERIGLRVGGPEMAARHAGVFIIGTVASGLTSVGHHQPQAGKA